LALGHTLTNGNVSRYGADHLQAEVLTALRGLDWAPALQRTACPSWKLFLQHSL